MPQLVGFDQLLYNKIKYTATVQMGAFLGGYLGQTYIMLLLLRQIITINHQCTKKTWLSYVGIYL